MNPFAETTTVSFSRDQLSAAYQWLCQQRRHHLPNADIWSFRFSWNRNNEALLKQINNGNYQFSPMKKVTTANGKTIHLWCSQDALVM